jgi:hypothetical protein
MPNSILIPTAQNLPDGFCPTSWQATVNAFAAAMRVTLPTSASQIIVQATTPVPADNDKIWFQVDVNNHVLAIRSYDSATGYWERVDEEQYYFNDIGTTNAIEINSSIAGDNVTALSDIVGRLLIIKVANANSATTVTIELDGLAATPVKVYGSQSLAVGNIQAGMICAFIYDGTNFQLLNPRYVVPANTYVVYSAESSLYTVPGNATGQDWPHGLTGEPTYFNCYLICQSAELGYAIGDKIPYVTSDTFYGTFFLPTFNLTSSATQLRLTAGGPTASSFFNLPNKATGGYNPGDPSKWKIQFVASKLVAA